ncbi:hypothetical protein LTR16_008699, partial [Cryomyces antarcticus]
AGGHERRAPAADQRGVQGRRRHVEGRLRHQRARLPAHPGQRHAVDGDAARRHPRRGPARGAAHPAARRRRRERRRGERRPSRQHARPARTGTRPRRPGRPRRHRPQLVDAAHDRRLLPHLVREVHGPDRRLRRPVRRLLPAQGVSVGQGRAGHAGRL